MRTSTGAVSLFATAALLVSCANKEPVSLSIREGTNTEGTRVVSP